MKSSWRFAFLPALVFLVSLGAFVLVPAFPFLYVVFPSSDYVPLHAGVELFSIVVALGIFAAAWLNKEQIEQVIARRRWFVSMRARLIAILVLVAILGGGPSVGSIFYLYQSDLHERPDSEYSTRNLVAAREIEITLDEIRGDLVVAASVPPVQGIVRAREGGGYDREGMSTYEEWVKRLQDIFVSIETAYQRYPQIRFLDENGNELVRVDWDGQQARAVPLPNSRTKPIVRTSRRR